MGEQTHYSHTVTRQGFTLIELVVVMLLATVVIGAIYNVYIAANKSYKTQDRVAEAQQRVRVGLEFMSADIRMAGFDPLDDAWTGIENATATNLRITSDLDMNGVIDIPLNEERVTYDFSNNSLRRRLYEGTANQQVWQTVIDNVNTLTFSYLDENDALLTAPVASNELGTIRAIAITMTVVGMDADGNTFTRTMNTRIRCRNIGH